MTLVTKNLGLVKAIDVSLTSPSNTNMLWYDDNTGQKIHKYYNTITSTWDSLIPPATPSALASVLAIGNKTNELDIISNNGKSLVSILDAEIWIRSGITNKGELYLSENEADLYNQIGGFFAAQAMPTSNKYFQVKTASNIINHDILIQITAPLVTITGSLGVNITPTAAAHFKGIDATASNYTIKADNGAGSPLVYVRNDGVESAYFHSTGKIYMGTSTIGKSSGSNGIQISARGDANWTFGWNNGELLAQGVFESGVFMNVTATSSATVVTSLNNNAAKRWDYGIVTDNFVIRGVLNADSITTDVFKVYQTTGNVAMAKLATSNAGLVTGDLYVDTAANILANNDKVVGWKV